MMQPIRWSDNDRYFGPITYAKESRHYRPISIYLASGDDDDYPGCRLRLSAFGHTLIIALPAFLKPARHWYHITPEPTRTQMIEAGREPGYWHTYNREFGFSFEEGALHLHYGAQTRDSTTDKTRCWFYPWREHRCIRHSIYDLDGDLFATLPEWGFRHKNGYDARKALEAACPVAEFEFDDFDGERIVARTRIQEMEWKRGTGIFRLLFVGRNIISRSLDLQFNSEVGRRKGSWKGGTVGHSIDMLPGELHEAAFRRYCEKESLRFVGRVG